MLDFRKKWNDAENRKPEREPPRSPIRHGISPECRDPAVYRWIDTRELGGLAPEGASPRMTRALHQLCFGLR